MSALASWGCQNASEAVARLGNSSPPSSVPSPSSTAKVSIHLLFWPWSIYLVFLVIQFSILSWLKSAAIAGIRSHTSRGSTSQGMVPSQMVVASTQSTTQDTNNHPTCSTLQSLTRLQALGSKCRPAQVIWAETASNEPVLIPRILPTNRTVVAKASSSASIQQRKRSQIRPLLSALKSLVMSM